MRFLRFVYCGYNTYDEEKERNKNDLLVSRARFSGRVRVCVRVAHNAERFDSAAAAAYFRIRKPYSTDAANVYTRAYY